MFQSFLQGLLLLTTLIALVVGQRCRVPVPFTTRLVGKRFTKFDDCYRPSTEREFRVNAKTFVYKPLIIRTFREAACEERYVFHFRHNGKAPFVVHFPNLSYPGDDFNVSDEELKRFCDRKHKTVRKKYFPSGKTRKMFKESVRVMLKGAEEIRDFGCEVDDDGFVVQVQGRAFDNVDLDGIVTYLLSVAFRYNFCAESK